MTIVSSPIPGAAAPSGEDHNGLRNDLLYNHIHAGGNSGHTVSHLALTDKGTLNHADIDWAVAQLQVRIPARIESGRVTATGVPFSNWTRWPVVFSAAFPSQPAVVVSPEGQTKRCFYQVVNVTTAGFDILMYPAPANADHLTDDYSGTETGQDWTWMAMEQ